MKKLICMIVLLSLVTLNYAQQESRGIKPDAAKNLDTVIQKRWWDNLIKVEKEGDAFDTDETVLQILYRLYAQEAHTYNYEHGSFNGRWENVTSGALGSLRDDLDAYSAYASRFPASSEVAAAVLTSDAGNNLGYGDSFGGSYNDEEGIADYAAFSADNFTPTEHTVSYYVGRNQTAADGTAITPSHDVNYYVTTNNTRYTIEVYGTQTPIVLDMDGDRKLEASNGRWLPHVTKRDVKMVSFDMTGNGFDELVEWVGPNDGLLVDYQGGEITGENLFGSPGGFANGYEKLTAYDNNEDGKLTGSELANLSVWQDGNGNAKVDSGEIQSLSSLGITEISTTHKSMVSYFIQNGTKKVMWDWHPTTLRGRKMR